MHVWDYVPYAHPLGGPAFWDRAKDDFARTIINDLIAASSTQLETSIDQNLADRKAP